MKKTDVVIYCVNEIQYEEIKKHIMSNKDAWRSIDTWQKVGQYHPCINITSGTHGSYKIMNNFYNILTFEQWKKPINLTTGLDLITNLIGI